MIYTPEQTAAAKAAFEQHVRAAGYEPNWDQLQSEVQHYWIRKTVARDKRIAKIKASTKGGDLP